MASLKNDLADRPLIGSWIQIGDESLVEILARGPFDWLCVDLEHTAISIDQCGRIIRVADLAGCPTVVRLSGHDPEQIKRVLDAGATGIIAPMVKTADEAAAIVDAASYPPRGSRGVGLARAQEYGLGFTQYRERIERELVCIAQIEHIDGVSNIDAILEVPGIDGFIIGPYDLSASLGRPGEFDHPDVVAAIARLDEVARRPDTVAGIHVVEPDIEALRSAADRGYTFIAFGSDMLFFAHEIGRIAGEIASMELQ